jgi:hypothetical protein
MDVHRWLNLALNLVTSTTGISMQMWRGEHEQQAGLWDLRQLVTVDVN